MVKIENEKLIIEIETTMPINELQNLQDALLDAIRWYNAPDKTVEDYTLHQLTNLLKELQPTFEQNKVLYTNATR